MWKLSPKSTVLAQATEYQSGKIRFNPQFSDHASSSAERHPCPLPVPLWEVMGSCCLLDLGHCNDRGPCEPAKWMLFPPRLRWSQLPRMVECWGVQTGCSHPALAFTGGPASASDVHNHPVGEGRSQAHHMQMVPRGRGRKARLRSLISAALINL